MTLKKTAARYLRKTPLFLLAREAHTRLNPGLNNLRRSEEADLRHLVERIGSLLQQPLHPRGSAAKTVLIMGMGRVRFIALESVLRKAFELAGYRCSVIVPQEHMVIKAYRALGSDTLVFFDKYCTKPVQTSAKRIETCVHLDDVTSLSYKGVRCGKYAVSTLMRTRRAGSFDLSDPGIRHDLTAALDKSLSCVETAYALVQDIKPDLLVLLDRGYSPSGELFDVCIEKNIPVITWNAAHRNDLFMLKRYTAANRDTHPSSLSEKTWQALREMPWLPQYWDRLKHEMEHCYNSGEWYAEVGTQINKKPVGKAELIKRLNVDPTKKIAVIFPHIFWDATFFWGSDLFESYEEWFIQTVRAACKNDRVNWIIKVHPANMVKDKRDGVSSEHSEIASIRKAVGRLPPHVHLLTADTDISTLSLFPIMDVCVTVRGTVGIEAACFSVPVLTAGTGRFDRMGFTADSDSKEEYLSRIATAETLAPLDETQTELARRYAHGFLMCRPARLRALTMRYRQNAMADLDVEYHVASPRELQASEDVKNMAAWITSPDEDYLDPSFTPLRETPGAAPDAKPLAWNDALVRHFWDYYAQFSETYFTSQFGRGIIRSVARYLPKDATILDYACGTGALTGHMLAQGLKVAGCDISSDSLAVVRERFGHKPGFLGTHTVSGLGNDGARFDVVFLVELIEHVDDAALAQIFDNVTHCLKPGGVLIVTTPNNEDLGASTVFCPSCNHTFHRWQHVRSWSPSALSRLFASRGLQPVALFSTDFSLESEALSGRNILRRLARTLSGRESPHLVGIARKSLQQPYATETSFSLREKHFDLYWAQRYRLETAAPHGNGIGEGLLHPLRGGPPVAIRGGIPRFVEHQDYAENFGLQWNAFRSTQLDSATGLPLSAGRLWSNTRWKPEDLRGKTVLEIGSGAGRFTEILLKAGARVVSIDLSRAVDANWKNNRDKGDLLLCQCDLYDLPFPKQSFDYVFCYGVLQHTPDPPLACHRLLEMLKPGGRISLDYYRRFRWPNVWATPKYLWRPLTRNMNPDTLLKIIQAYMPFWLPVDTMIRRIPYLGSRLLAFIPIPCWNYLHIGLTKKQRLEWAVMDTFDALGASYDTSKTLEEVREMITCPNAADIEVFYGSNGIVANAVRAP